MPDRAPGRDSPRWKDLARRIIAPHRPYVAILLLVSFIYLPTVWLRHAWNPDEPRYAEVAREMVSSGEYLLPHLNGEVHAEKPPVYFWLSILASRVTGIPLESGPRLVSVIAAWLAIVLTFRIGLRLADPETAWLAALVLATSSMFVLHASAGVIDGTLTLLIVAAIAIGMRARDERSPVLWLLFYLVTAVAVLTKGPVGFLIPAGVIALLSLTEGGLSGLRAFHPVWGLGVILAVASVWLVPAIARGGPDYAETILWTQNVGRAINPWHHEKPFHYFLKVFPVSFLPWAILLPTAIFGAWRSARAEEREWSRVVRLAAIWFGFVFIFFSLASSKKTRYLLPLFPAASLLVAVELRKTLAARTGWLRARLPLALVCILFALVGLAMALLPAAGPDGTGHLVQQLDRVPPQQAVGLDWLLRMPGGLLLIVPGLAIATAAILALRLLRSDRRTGLACLAASIVIVLGVAHWVVMPALDPVKSGRPIAKIAMEAAGPAGEIVLYKETFQGMFNLLMKRDRLTVERRMERLRALLEGRTASVVIASQPETQKLVTQIDDLMVIGCLRIGSKMFCASRLDQGTTSASTVEPASSMTRSSRPSEEKSPEVSKAATVSSSSSGTR